MKWFAILFVGILADGSFARKCGSNQKVNLTFLPDEAAQASLTYPTPTIENNEDISHTLKKNFVKIQQNYGELISEFIYQEALAVVDQLIDAVQKAYAELEESIKLKSKNNKKSNRVDDSLKSLTKEFRLFLNLKPGNVTIEPPTLPGLPPQPAEIISQTKNRTASDLFLHLAEFYDTGISSVYGFISAIFLRGMKTTRNLYGIVQAQYRNELLNGAVLDAYEKVAKQVFNNRRTIQKQVTPETWYAFEEAGDRIIKIANDYCKDS